MTKRNDILTCAYCDKKIADYINDELVPDFVTLYKQGKDPVPNMGWLCSEECALSFEKKHDVKFSRTASGKIDYYENEIK